MRESRHYPFILDFSDHRNRHSANESIIKYRANISIRVFRNRRFVADSRSWQHTRYTAQEYVVTSSTREQTRYTIYFCWRGTTTNCDEYFDRERIAVRAWSKREDILPFSFTIVEIEIFLSPFEILIRTKEILQSSDIIEKLSNLNLI